MLRPAATRRFIGLAVACVATGAIFGATSAATLPGRMELLGLCIGAATGAAVACPIAYALAPLARPFVALAGLSILTCVVAMSLISLTDNPPVTWLLTT